MGPKTRKLLKSFGLLLIIVTVILGARLWYLEEQGNFHAITPGEAYRSAQLDQDELQHYVQKYRIRSVINLLGKDKKAKWYRDEVSMCKDLGVAHYDIKLPARSAPSEARIKKLISIFKSAPRPVLIHCKSGADRSGLAAAIWLVEIDSMPPSRARKELSIKYGHLPIGPTHILDRFFDDWVKKHGIKGTSKTDEIQKQGKVKEELQKKNKDCTLSSTESNSSHLATKGRAEK